ncbi:unnamed protein product [Sphagnum jensenii]
MAVKTRRKNGGGMMGFRFMDTGSLPTLIGPASLFEGHVTDCRRPEQQIHVLENPQKFHSTLQMESTVFVVVVVVELDAVIRIVDPLSSTFVKWQIWNSSTGGNPSEEDEEVEGRRESTHFMVSVKLAKEA